jgi:hypothetical protein
MNFQLLQWGLFSFMLGLILSLPLAAVHYQKAGRFTRLFTNVRKLKSAHIDFFLQAVAIGFVYLLEAAVKIEFPIYVVAPLFYGTIGNPLILLLEATPLQRSGVSAIVYKLLLATSPLSLLIAWCLIALLILPGILKLLLLAFVVIGVFAMMKAGNKESKSQEKEEC